MNINRSVVRTVGTGVVLGAMVLAVPITSGVQIGSAQASGDSTTRVAQVRRSMGPYMVHTGPTGNKVEMVDPDRSMYRPRILKAPARSRAKARRLLKGVNNFCQTHSKADIKARWRPGKSNPSNPTHYFNPRRGASGIHPARPRAALVHDGRIDGVMFTGTPLPYLGTIPRAHSHHHMQMGGHAGVEMVHVYCARDLSVKSMREAYTPNRQLGVMADTKRLRLRIRPAVMNLNRHQLREVRAKVRGYVGEHAPQRAKASRGGPDPVLQAMRTEIRRSLMRLSERRLRSVWRLMKSY